jgi:hypothetical protein
VLYQEWGMLFGRVPLMIFWGFLLVLYVQQRAWDVRALRISWHVMVGRILAVANARAACRLLLVVLLHVMGHPS